MSGTSIIAQIFVPLRATNTDGAKDLDAEKRGIQTKPNHHILTDITTRV